MHCGQPQKNSEADNCQLNYKEWGDDLLKIRTILATGFD